MTDLDEFLPLITPFAPGCPDPTAFSYLIKAARTFCERTRLWCSDDSFTLSGQHCEFVCVPDGAELFEISSAAVDGRPLQAISFDELVRRYPGWRDDQGAPGFISQYKPDSIVLYPFDQQGTLQLLTTLRPVRDAEQLPDFLFREHSDTIADGALAKILMTPNKSFTNPDAAAMYARQFSDRIDQLFTQRARGKQRTPLRSKGRYM